MKKKKNDWKKEIFSCWEIWLYSKIYQTIKHGHGDYKNIDFNEALKKSFDELSRTLSWMQSLGILSYNSVVRIEKVVMEESTSSAWDKYGKNQFVNGAGHIKGKKGRKITDPALDFLLYALYFHFKHYTKKPHYQEIAALLEKLDIGQSENLYTYADIAMRINRINPKLLGRIVLNYAEEFEPQMLTKHVIKHLFWLFPSLSYRF